MVAPSARTRGTGVMYLDAGARPRCIAAKNASGTLGRIFHYRLPGGSLGANYATHWGHAQELAWRAGGKVQLAPIDAASPLPEDRFRPRCFMRFLLLLILLPATALALENDYVRVTR